MFDKLDKLKKKLDAHRPHPFIDGNGRTSRLLMNLELMKSGFPPVVIAVEQRLRYYQSLDKLHTSGDYSDFLELVSDLTYLWLRPPVMYSDMAVRRVAKSDAGYRLT